MTAPFMKRGVGHRPRVKLRELFQADADIIPDHERGILRVRMLGGADKAADASLAPLFEELNGTETIYPGTKPRLVSNCRNSRKSLRRRRDRLRLRLNCELAKSLANDAEKHVAKIV